jgi:hypothetical protein
MKEFEPGFDEAFFNSETLEVAPCPDPPADGGNPTALYRLKGPQVEFEAAYWLVNPQLRIPAIKEVMMKVGTPKPYPTDKPTLDKEIAELKSLATKRDNNLPEGYLSQFINLQDPPFGAIFNTRGTQYRVDAIKQQDSRIKRLPKTLIKTGRQLARMFENETPGLLHHHALNWLLYLRTDLSPVRHARIWAALDMTLYAALSAAWHYKWALDKKTISFRQRPWEYDQSLTVLYDKEVNERGDGDGKRRGCPCPTPGTPRHPAYPSGHSTYSAAASHILKYFFARDTFAVQELDKLANNIGEARLWAGVHWRTDHEFGQTVGRAVADVIIDQLKKDCVPIVSTKTCEERKNEMPPSDDELKKAKDARDKDCEHANEHDQIPTREEAPKENRVF